MARAWRFRWTNFRAFRDTGVIELPALTVLLGPNASGKTSLVAPLLMLKQTIEATDANLALKAKGRWTNAGSYSDFIHNQDTTRPLSLDVTWFGRRATGEDASAKLRDLPPVSMGLQFGWNGEKRAPFLQRWSLSDPLGRVLLSRTREESGRYSLEGVQLPANSLYTRAILEGTPEGFMFTPASVLSSWLEPNAPRSTKSGLEQFSHEHNFYVTCTGFAETSIGNAFDGLQYLGPIRDRPKRLYEIGGEIPFSVGVGGQFAPEMIWRAPQEAKDRIDYWLQQFDLARGIVVRDHRAAGSFSLHLRHGPKYPEINIVDTGFGLSQLLPLIVQAVTANPGDTVIAEQPEIHLNPRLQVVLADLFVDMISRDINVVLETHSEHLVVRLRNLVARGVCKAEDVGLYYCERSDGESRIRRIEVDKHGGIESTDWPKGFFAEGLSEALSFAQAQAESRRAP